MPYRKPISLSSCRRLQHGSACSHKNVQVATEVNLGLVRLTNGGETAQLLWGYTDGGRFTSEFPAHMMSHAERLKVDLT